ncbi:sodium/proline symporter PutP [Congzhengia minquanensis]|uniref:Sodium/proline symporter n=1 Tax=Congzhengia minquanensis TaxID=2763657 RepID=A0A926HUH5_9FIRM|nr:sodium/proline symporter PutP [Congzhengia minquanensis]MBC8540587.1 sodium/proline symporter PutP [Congzhengia minquanensis]
MTSDRIQILIAMCCYMAVIVLIGVYYAKKANENSENYFLGGRGLSPWVAAMSAEASDMSGWLLMGLPGVAYWCGLADAVWTAIGLAVGTYLNWLIISKRLRRYSVKVGAITLPEFFSNRFKEKKGIIMAISALFILIFFTVYAASCLVTCGKLFSTLFQTSYIWMMILGAVFVLFYTFLGGFLAESVSDFLQGIIMIIALVAVLAVGTASAGGFNAVLENSKNIPGFLEFFGTATPALNESGVQAVQAGAPVFGPRATYSALTIASALAWGLGYFGMPQVLLRFMAIRKENELKMSRRIAIIWCVISLIAAVVIGLIGRTLYPTDLLTKSSAENVFILMSTNLLPPLLAGFAMAGILAATMSSSDSYLLIASSALARNIYSGLFKKNATDKQVMNVSRITLVIITLIAIVIALDENSVIFSIVSFAWAGFGATFGPLVVFSLFWKRINSAGAVAGMVGGGAMVFLWKLVIAPMAGGIFAIYELLPAFIFSSLCIVVVSLLTKAPSDEVVKDFEEVRLNK